MSRAHCRLAVTTGDVNGVGLEITVKALREFARKKLLTDHRLIVFADRPETERFLKAGKTKLPQHAWVELEPKDSNSTGRLLNATLDSKLVLAHLHDTNEAGWFEFVLKHYKSLKLDGVVTGPVSKTTFVDHNPEVMGHTGLLRRAFPKRQVFQGYRGERFNIVLATDHIPLHRVESSLTPPLIQAAIQACHQLRETITDRVIRSRPIAVLGLNPHASEGGLIGDYDDKVLRPVIARMKRLNVVGPISADSAFTESNQGRFSVYLCLYHDQGLIPFKTVHGMSDGYQISLGVPILRTSVDHGTAPDLVGRHCADAGSMKAAILGAIAIAKGSK